MTRKISPSQRRKHEKIAQEFLASRMSVADIEKADSATLHAYQILQETLVVWKRKRAEAGLTLDDVAHSSGIDKAYLSRLENGKVLNPTFETLYRYVSSIGPVESMRDLSPV